MERKSNKSSLKKMEIKDKIPTKNLLDLYWKIKFDDSYNYKKMRKMK